MPIPRHSDTKKPTDTNGSKAKTFDRMPSNAALNRIMTSGGATAYLERIYAELATADDDAKLWALVIRLWRLDGWHDLLKQTIFSGPLPPPNLFAGRILPDSIRTIMGLGQRNGLIWALSAMLLAKDKAAKSAMAAIAENKTELIVLIDSVSVAIDGLQSAGINLDGKAGARILALLEIHSTREVSSGLAQLVGLLRGAKPIAKLAMLLLEERAALRSQAQQAVLQRQEDEALFNAAWRDADSALARALQNADGLYCTSRLADNLTSDLTEAIGEAVQAIRTAASKRELYLGQDLGEIRPFNPTSDAHDDPRITVGSTVKVLKSAVFQGRKSNPRVVRFANVISVSQKEHGNE
jgi:hypothetical protein